MEVTHVTVLVSVYSPPTTFPPVTYPHNRFTGRGGWGGLARARAQGMRPVTLSGWSEVQAGQAKTQRFSFRRCRPPKVHFFKNLLRSVPNDFLRRFQIRVEILIFFRPSNFFKNFGGVSRKIFKISTRIWNLRKKLII